MKPLFALVLAGSLGAAGAAHAQVYKCVDANGKTVYSQARCPASAKSKTLDAHPAPSSPTPAAAKGGDADPRKADAEFRKRQLEEKEAEKKASEKNAEAQTKQENCQRARGALAQYEAGGRITRFKANGEREFLSDDEVAQEKGRAQSLVQEWCK